MDERGAGAEEEADCVPDTNVPLAWTRVDRVLAKRTRGKAAELEYLVKWQVRPVVSAGPLLTRHLNRGCSPAVRAVCKPGVSCTKWM